MRRRLTIAAAVLLAALVIAPSANAERVPTLTQPDAKYYANKALKRHDSLGYRASNAWIGRCNRNSRTRVTCKTAWSSAPDFRFYYRGRITIWYGQEFGRLYWYYSYRLRRTNYDCVAAGRKKRHCTKIIQVN